MSAKPSPKKKERKKTLKGNKKVVKKIKKVVKPVDEDDVPPTPEEVAAAVKGELPKYPANQAPLPIPPVDKATVSNIEKLIEISYLGYMKELKKKDIKDDCDSIGHLNSILSEYLGPYLLIGYMPDNEPVEILYAPTSKDKEAVLERLRRTFIQHMNGASPS